MQVEKTNTTYFPISTFLCLFAFQSQNQELPSSTLKKHVNVDHGGKSNCITHTKKERKIADKHTSDDHTSKQTKWNSTGQRQNVLSICPQIKYNQLIFLNDF